MYGLSGLLRYIGGVKWYNDILVGDLFNLKEYKCSKPLIMLIRVFADIGCGTCSSLCLELH